MKGVPSHELAYTIGLITGEGSFFVAMRDDDRYSDGFDYGPKFAISMGQFSQAMLNGQQDLYNLGAVNEHSKGYQWVLSSRDDCLAFANLIDDYLNRYDAPEFVLSPKFESYQTWRATLDLFEPGRELSELEIRKLARFREEINHLSGSGYLSSEEVKDILNRDRDEE